MNRQVERIIVGIVTAFVALSAIWGGFALLLGSYRHDVLVEAGTGSEFPVAWLYGTPFSDYTIPALVLAVVVGGSALIAALTIFAGGALGVFMSLAAGLILAGFIAVEVLTLKQIPVGPTVTEEVYFGLGLLMVVLATHLWTTRDRHQPARLNRK